MGMAMDEKEKIPNRGHFVWDGLRPAKNLWTRMFKLYSPALRPGGKLKIFTFEDIYRHRETLEEKELFFHQKGGLFYSREVFQQVQLYSTWDRELVKKAMKGWSVREIYQIRGKTLMGDYIKGPLVKGGTNKVGDLLDGLKTIKELSKKAREYGDSLESIDISHIHPSLEIIESYEGSTKFFLNGLSSTDLKFQRTIYRELRKKIPVKVKALTLFGHGYSHRIGGKES
jgi:hypothetical protein